MAENSYIYFTFLEMGVKKARDYVKYKVIAVPL